MLKPCLIISATVLFACLCIAATFWAMCLADSYTFMVRQSKEPNVINLHSDRSIYMTVKGRDFDIDSGVTG